MSVREGIAGAGSCPAAVSRQPGRAHEIAGAVLTAVVADDIEVTVMVTAGIDRGHVTRARLYIQTDGTLIVIAGGERREAAVRRKDGGVAFAAGLSALKRLEARGLVEKLPGACPGDDCYSAWGTRWRVTDTGREALS